MKTLDKKAILSAQDRELHQVEVPEWGGAVYVKPASSSDFDTWSKNVASGRMENMKAELVAICACDEKGKLLFDKPDDVVELGKKSEPALLRLYKECERLNDFTRADVEQLEKNLKAIRNGGFGSESPTVEVKA